MRPSSNMVQEHSRLAVYEALNDDLKEIYVGASSQPLSRVESGHSQDRPRSIRHWKQEHKIRYRQVADSLGAEDAGAFIKHYAGAMKEAGWKVWEEIPKG